MGINKTKLPSVCSVLLIIMIFKVEACQRTILRANGVTEYEKQIILKTHNELRQLVALGRTPGQPPAANMMELKWDDELARRAQMWASHCHTKGHDKGKDLPRFPVGQNIATTWTTKTPSSYEEIDPDFAQQIKKWFEEYRYFNFGGRSRGLTGHYTQMLWAETSLVGCGFTFYYDNVRGYTKYYVCNYGPGGNVYGQMPYDRGYSSCQKYGLTDSKNYDGLCDKPNNYYYISNYIA